MVTELHAAKINNYLLLYNAKLASSFIGNVTDNIFLGIEYESLHNKKANFFVEHAHQAEKIVIIIKEPYKKLMSGLFTIFVTELKKFPRMVKKFEIENGYEIGYSQRLIDEINKDPNFRVMNDGFIFHREFFDDEREYFVSLFSYLMERAFKDANTLSDVHLRPHHFTAVLIMTELILKHKIPQEKFVYIDITEQNQLLFDIVKNSLSSYEKTRLEERTIASVQNASSDSWKNVLSEAYFTLDNLAIKDRLGHEEKSYELLRTVLKELKNDINE